MAATPAPGGGPLLGSASDQGRRPTVAVIDPSLRPRDFMTPVRDFGLYVWALADVNVDIIHFTEAGRDRVMDRRPTAPGLDLPSP